MKKYCKGRAQEWAYGRTSQGHTQIAVAFAILDGEHAGRTLTWFGHFTEKTVDRTLDSLRHCGWDGDDPSDLTGLDRNEVQLVIDDEEYNGQTRTKIQFVNRLGGLALKDQLSPDEVRAFAARLRGRAVAHKQKYGGQPAAPKTSSRAGYPGDNDSGDNGWPGDDDIPF